MRAPQVVGPKGLRSTWPSPRRGGFTLIELVVAVLVIVCLIALLLPATRRARPAALRTQCKNNLKQIGLALHNYHDVYGTFPPTYTVDAHGKPLHSWRTLILPYLDQAPLYNKINLSKAWDDPANEAAFKTNLPVYCCPSAPVASSQAVYLAVDMEGSCLRPGGSLKVSEIKDGTSNTVLVIEVLHDQAVHWMSPHDADPNILEAFQPKSKESHTGGRHALLADGAVRFLSQNLSRQTFQALCTATGGETVGEF